MFRKLVATGLIIAAACTVFAEESSNENVFQKGLAAYQNKQFREARDSFQKILEQGNGTPELWHNLALANYQLNHKPLALAFWRKALSYDPSFRPARLGRSFAEAELGQRGFERDRITEFLRGTLEFISIFEALWIVALLIGISGWLWIRFWGERRRALDEERPLPPFPSAALVVTIALMSVVLLTLVKARQQSRQRGTIVTNNASARSLPADEGVGLFDLRGGAEVLVRRREGDWAQVQNGEGSSGWVKKTELFITSRP